MVIDRAPSITVSKIVIVRIAQPVIINNILFHLRDPFILKEQFVPFSLDGLQFQEQALKYYRQTILDRMLQWSCADECQYGCMWRTVEVFRARKMPVPQFFGKVLNLF